MATYTKNQKQYKYEPEPEITDHALIGGSLFLPYILIPLAIWRAVSNKHLNYRRGSAYKLISFQLILSFVSYIVYGFFFNSIFSYIVAVIAISFVLMVIMAGFYMNRSERYIKLVEHYRQVIFVHGITNINEIAEQVRQPQLSVTKDIEYLMDKGHFQRGAIVDGELIFELNVAQAQSFLNELGHSRTNIPIKASAQATFPQPKTVECTGCGSKVMLENTKIKECDYCGILLNSG